MEPEKLLERARALDESALASIHDLYYPTIYRFVRYRLEDEQVVEDIAAEVFLRFLEALTRRTTEIRDLRAWLMGTTANLINDHLRRKYRRPVEDLEDYEFLPGKENPEGSAETNEQQNMVRQSMHRLTHDQQLVISLRFLLDCSIEETARLMRKTEGAVKVLQFRALASLRKNFEGIKKR
jgi:RNA polymerase sigma-70 factor, ECF subfamily